VCAYLPCRSHIRHVLDSLWFDCLDSIPVSLGGLSDLIDDTQGTRTSQRVRSVAGLGLDAPIFTPTHSASMSSASGFSRESVCDMDPAFSPITIDGAEWAAGDVSGEPSPSARRAITRHRSSNSLGSALERTDEATRRRLVSRLAGMNALAKQSEKLSR